MSAPTGANRGGGLRGRGGLRVGPQRGTTGGANGVPLAAQMKQIQRLDEPKEMALFRRFKDLGITQVQSVYGPTGLIGQKICVPSQNFTQIWGLRPSSEATTELSLLEAENVLSNIESARARERMVSRAGTRLGLDPGQVDLSRISSEDRAILQLSNAEYDRRYPRVPSGNAVVAGGGVDRVAYAPVPPVKGPKKGTP